MLHILDDILMALMGFLALIKGICIQKQSRWRAAVHEKTPNSERVSAFDHLLFLNPRHHKTSYISEFVFNIAGGPRMGGCIVNISCDSFPMKLQSALSAYTQHIDVTVNEIINSWYRNRYY